MESAPHSNMEFVSYIIYSCIHMCYIIYILCVMCVCIHVTYWYAHIYIYTSTRIHSHRREIPLYCPWFRGRSRDDGDSRDCPGQQVGARPGATSRLPPKGPTTNLGPPNVLLLRAFWSLLDGIWGLLKGSGGVLEHMAVSVNWGHLF